MTPRRTLKFDPLAEKARNGFLGQWDENARKCLDWLEQLTCRAPQDGTSADGLRYFHTVEVETKDPRGVLRCKAVYIFNETAAKWLLFSHKFIPEEQQPADEA